MKHEQKLYWFDLFRGVAALGVFFGHLRTFMFHNYWEHEELDLLGKAFFFLTGYGHEAVTIFFVLSGFFIIRSIHETSQSGRWNPFIYASKRLSRLWIVLIPALFLTLFWDTISTQHFQDLEIYSSIRTITDGFNPEGKLGWKTFLGNVFFLQTIKVNTYGSNGALWSLAYEFWFYALFPLAYFIFKKGVHFGMRIVCFLFFLLVAYFVNYSIMMGFLVWLLGGITYLTLNGGKLSIPKGRFWGVIYGLTLLLVLACIRFRFKPVYFNDYSLGLSVALFLSYLSSVPLENSLIKKVIKFLSEISYTLYLVHIPVAICLISWLFPEKQYYSFIMLLVYLGIAAVLIGYSYLVYYVFERNTKMVKDYFINLFTKKGKGHPAV